MELPDSQGDNADIAEELEGARATIAHMSDAMSWISGHDRSGRDHLEDATRLAARLDRILLAYVEYEAALQRLEHGAVAADRLIRVVADVFDAETAA